ncbi:radical SAM protein [Candidatus Omnitrophus magneticus]|uniref:Radical SAM protein n=1 Tax=Candidatus Omnitrophus magneticus TaxID=1609969 RepID=A0A0F0CRN5_9BACT|nr:radical SAM protein [Candidatus Omnitrophus magneticus]
MNKFLPISQNDLRERSWSGLDIILITGDAYVDHPSYGVSVISRVLENRGFKVGIISQPDWRNAKNFTVLGKPRLFFGITAGNTDSMIANYTANKRPRSDDDYSPGSKGGMRPDRACIVYANKIREVFKDVPIVLGGIEASLRRLAHYDYWDDSVRRSILFDSRADILVYGMGERQIVEIAELLDNGENIRNLNNIRGTAVVRGDINFLSDYLCAPSFEDVSHDKENFNEMFLLEYNNMNPKTAKTLVQKYDTRFLVRFPPAFPLSEFELDKVYELPYARSAHSSYDSLGGVKGFETVKFSITSHRGCAGECAFCALYFHQGRIVQSRSAESILEEARKISIVKDFRGTISDVGGPTANMFGASCSLWKDNNFCAGKKCLIPQKCENFKLGYDKCLDIYREIRKISGVKHMFIGSGMRYDLLVDSYAIPYLKEICAHHISGLLKIAPEHSSNNVLKLMNKPSFDVYEKFVKLFKETAHSIGKNIFIVNYFISAYPGSSLKEALNLALYLAKRKVHPEQIQDFIPSPATLAACFYYTEKDPFTRKPVYVPKTFRERKLQRALIQHSNPVNKSLVIEALKKLNAMHVLKKLSGR